MSAILSGRMDALALANALVRRTFGPEGAADSADLGDIVRTVLRPHERPGEKSRFVIEGPPVRLGEHSVNGIALVLHEFATNAAKYGALQNDAGAVAVTWRKADGRLVLDWTERGGPPVKGAPERTGFGAKLTHATVVEQFDGSLTYDWDAGGLKAVMSLPEDLSR
jgi:two-component sensor histidine kinase